MRQRILATCILFLVACGGEDLSGNPGNGSGVQDRDNDGITDRADMCPTQPETVNGFEDSDGCPDTAPPPDSDADGILDANDQCPQQAETPNNFNDADGCPEQVNPNFTGTFSGPVRVRSPGIPDLVYDGFLRLTANDDRLVVEAYCPDASGRFETIGDGDQVSWSGNAICNFQSQTCPSTTLAFQAAVFRLTSSRTIEASGSGTLGGCGDLFQVTYTINGSK